MVSPIVIAGPTASGKSKVAFEIAKEKNGELICADSRQIYAQMQIGTAGPSKKELTEIRHHGFGIIDPDTVYDAGMFVKDTDKYVADVFSRNKTPILVGGTGLYLKSFRFGLQDVPPKSDVIRAKLAKEREELGREALFERLSKIDPDSAKIIEAKDEVRILRALEIFEITGRKPSELRVSHNLEKPRLQADWILLCPSAPVLNENIEKRVYTMFENGLVNEALALRRQVKTNTQLLETMGYKEALLLADKDIKEENAIERTIIRHRQYAKRQQTWFKKESWWKKLPVEPAK